MLQYYREGRFAPGTLYWRDGMADWRPLEELVRGASVSPQLLSSVVDGRSTGGRYTFVKDPKLITMVLLAFLGLTLLMDCISMAFDWLEYMLLSRDYTQMEADMNDLRQGLLGLAYLGLYFITVIIFSMWLHRANKNSHGFGARGMQFTPGWAVGYYFIPILNIWKPYQSMKEMWQISQDPEDWEMQPSGLVGLWWAFWLITSVMGQIYFRASMNAVTVEEFKHAAMISLVTTIPSVILTILAMLLVRKLYLQQKALVEGQA